MAKLKWLNSNIYLYGSRVLEINKTTNGTAKAYQEIAVEEGKTYIVTGFIQNKKDSGNGAYIEAVADNDLITYLDSSNKVKNSPNFVKYEYKFTANESGKVKIYLENETVSEWLSDGTIFGWNFNNGCDFIQVNDESLRVFNENCGNKYLELFYNSSLTQTINTPGSAGDTFVFGGYCFYDDSITYNIFG